ncbi:MAG: sialidase family protein [Caldicoprobacterales bacterium]|jgi:hypothetical protein
MGKLPFKIIPPDVPNEGILFVDHQSSGRSGHLGHALVEYAPGCILAFYSNCSGRRNNGHSGFGWMEYRRSTDYGQSWGEPQILEYSYKSFLDGLFTISCEKAVVPEENHIVLFCIRNDAYAIGWEPWFEPAVLHSKDGGHSWSEPIDFSDKAGRIYDAVYKDGCIYALEFCNDGKVSFVGNDPSHVYRLYVSLDGGYSFQVRSELPLDTRGRGYGALEWLPDGRLIAYIYNYNDEYNLECCISDDGGFTWSEPVKSYCAKRIRNPQVVRYKDLYFLHGRSGCVDKSLPSDFVLYHSKDGLNWDEGILLRKTQDTAPEGFSARPNGAASYYSNNLVTGRFGGPQRLLIQASDAYSSSRTNIRHWWIEIP